MRNRPILVIDDDSMLCTLIISALTDAGFEVLIALGDPKEIDLAREAKSAGIQLLHFVEDSRFPQYRSFLSQIAADSARPKAFPAPERPLVDGNYGGQETGRGIY